MMEILQTKLSKDEFSEIIQMPEMDGFEATKFIPEKEENNERHIPIVAMMANAI